MTAGAKAAALAVALSLSAAAAGAADYRAEIVAQAIEPCFLHPTRQRPAEARSPEAMARALMLLHAEELAKVVDSINRQLESDPPAVARRQIYRVALRACSRQGTATLGTN